MDVSAYFEDDDGDALSYAVAVDGNAANASISGAALTVNPLTRGSATVTLTASDPKARSATQSFSVTVSDSELQGVAAQALAHHARAVLSATSSVISARLESPRADSGFSFGRYANRFADYMPVNEGEGIATVDIHDNVMNPFGSNGPTF